jgi:hypothetical protein
MSNNPEGVEKWQWQFEKLQEYHKIHGDCNVPRKWNEDPSLGTWVKNQSVQYKHNESGEFVMDQDRIEQLEKLGFKLTLRVHR